MSVKLYTFNFVSLKKKIAPWLDIENHDQKVSILATVFLRLPDWGYCIIYCIIYYHLQKSSVGKSHVLVM